MGDRTYASLTIIDHRPGCAPGMEKAVLKVVLSDDSTDEFTVPCTYTGQELAIGFNPEYLAGVLSDLDGNEATLEFVDNQKATKLKQGDLRMRIIMPVRIS